MQAARSLVLQEVRLTQKRGPMPSFVPNWCGVALPTSLDLCSLNCKMRGLGLIFQKQCCVVTVGIEGVSPTAQISGLAQDS